MVRRIQYNVQLQCSACVSPCGICLGQNGTGIDFSHEFFSFPVSIITPWPSILISSGG